MSHLHQNGISLTLYSQVWHCNPDKHGLSLWSMNEILTRREVMRSPCPWRLSACWVISDAEKLTVASLSSSIFIEPHQALLPFTHHAALTCDHLFTWESHISSVRTSNMWTITHLSDCEKGCVCLFKNLHDCPQDSIPIQSKIASSSSESPYAGQEWQSNLPALQTHIARVGHNVLLAQDQRLNFHLHSQIENSLFNLLRSEIGFGVELCMLYSDLNLNLDEELGDVAICCNTHAAGMEFTCQKWLWPRIWGGSEFLKN